VPRKTRAIHWIKAARKNFESFPPGARDAFLKKSKSGIPTARQDIDGVRERLKEMIR
jgi:phage-related protein